MRVMQLLFSIILPSQFTIVCMFGFEKVLRNAEAKILSCCANLKLPPFSKYFAARLETVVFQNKLGLLTTRTTEIRGGAYG
jgi:hypothetical protein